MQRWLLLQDRTRLLLRGLLQTLYGFARGTLRVVAGGTTAEQLHVAADVDHDLDGAAILTVLALSLADTQTALDADLGTPAQVLAGGLR